MTHQSLKRKKLFIKAFKIAVGSVAAILIATWLNLEFASAAGIIALLSIVSTKWDTLKLFLSRIISFFAIILLALATYPFIGSEWVAYGVFIFITVLFSSLLGVESTISTNAVIGTHFLATGNFNLSFILNEFLLVFIGTATAVVINMINGNESQKNKIKQDMMYVEEKLKMILNELADYMRYEDKERNVWQDIRDLEEHLAYSVECTYEYQGNTFASHPGYYIEYMEMRTKQCNILHNLHHEINKIRKMPAQAEVIANYMSYLKDYVTERNIPDKQEQELQRLFSEMKQQPLPKTREEFENRAILYHILMDLEDFLIYKRRFITALTDQQKGIYWS